jgi:protocatechuate 3,4-dioxygenase beta subunit
MKRFFLLTASILFLGMTVSAQAGEILGRVTTARGQAIVSIRVMVTDEAGRVISSSITNADGAYEIKGVAPGRYKIDLLPLTGGSPRTTFQCSRGTPWKQSRLDNKPTHAGLCSA